MFLSSPSASSQQRTSWWILFVMCCISIVLMQAAHAKERIRYHINGPDGSTLRVVDQKGVAVAAYRYAPFGEQLASKKPHNLHGQQGFVSGVHERNDLVYLKHRYYNPRIGRFYQPDPVTFLSGGIGQINRYQYGWNDPLTFKDPSGLEPTAWAADTLKGFISGLDNSPSGVGKYTGSQAASFMKNYEGYTFSLNGAEPKQGWLNTQPFRYIYTSKGGWIDMQHFMYYASVAYNSKVNYPELTNDQAILRAAISGYRQENLYDRMFANHSAFSYEDLPSDLFGARFGAIYFNPNSKLSLSQQIGSYIETLGPMYPFMAPNYNKIPTKDSNIGNTPSYTNKNFSPMFTR